MNRMLSLTLRSFKALLVLIVLTCLSLSPSFMQDLNALEPTNQIVVDHPVDDGIGIKNGASQQKLLAQPLFILLFYILPFATIVRTQRLARYRYPSVFLLRKKLLLQPIQFTSIFLIRSFA